MSNITLKEIVENEELVRHITEDIEDVPEDTAITYEVWAIGYDSDDDVTDTEMLLKEFNDPDKAVEYAKQITLADIIHQAAEEDNGMRPSIPIEYISVEVETVIHDPEDEFIGGTMNIGTIYKKELEVENTEFEIEEPDAIVQLSRSDFSILDDGSLKVSCKLLKNFNKNDHVRFHFVDEAEPGSFSYKIMSKVIYEDGDYYHCDFIY